MGVQEWAENPLGTEVTAAPVVDTSVAVSLRFEVVPPVTCHPIMGDKSPAVAYVYHL